MQSARPCAPWRRPISTCPTQHRGNSRNQIPSACAQFCTSQRRRSTIATRSSPRSCPTPRSEEHTSELQSRGHLVCRLLLEKKNKTALIHIDSSHEALST